MTTMEMQNKFHGFMDSALASVEEQTKQKKPYTVRVHLEMIVECAVNATSEEEAEEKAEYLVDGHFYDGTISGWGFEIGANETDMTIKSYGIKATGDTIEEEDV